MSVPIEALYLETLPVPSLGALPLVSVACLELSVGWKWGKGNGLNWVKMKDFDLTKGFTNDQISGNQLSKKLSILS